VKIGRCRTKLRMRATTQVEQIELSRPSYRSVASRPSVSPKRIEPMPTHLGLLLERLSLTGRRSRLQGAARDQRSSSIRRRWYSGLTLRSLGGSKNVLDYALSSAIKVWYKTGTYNCFCGFERWHATRCNFKRGSARPSLLFFTERRIGAGRQ
jgi:hypothetical protein